MSTRRGLGVVLLACALAVSTGRIAAADVINFDTTATPWSTLLGVYPGTTTDTLKYDAYALMDTRPEPLVAGQTYHVTVHTTPGTAFRLDPATAGLEVVLHTQNRASTSGGSTPITATDIGTATLAGQNVTGAPLNLDLRDENAGASRVGVSAAAPTTYAGIKADPTRAALVTDLTFDFTTPPDYVTGPGTPYYLYSVDLVATQTVPHGQTTGPWIVGFAQVPEPGGLATLCIGALALRRRRRRPTATRSSRPGRTPPKTTAK